MKKFPIAMAVAGASLLSNLAMAQSQSLPEVTVTASPVIDSNNTDRFGSYPMPGVSAQVGLKASF